MKITLITNSGGDGRVQYGGAESLIAHLCPALRDRGHEILVVTPPGRLFDELAAQDIGLRAAGPRRYFDPAYISDLRTIIRDSTPDVLSLHLQSAAMHARLALPSRAFPHLVALHNNLTDIRQGERRRSARARVLIAMGVDRALSELHDSCYVAVSDLDLRLLEAHGRKAILVRNSLPNGWPQAPTAAEVEATDRRVGFLGRYEYQKGYDRFLALARACPDIDFVSCGRGVMGVDLPDNVTDLGESRMPADFLRTLDVAVIPSRWEIFGRVAVEAMSQAAHVLHSGVGALDEHDPTGRNSTEVSPWTTDTAAAALRAYLAAPTTANAQAQWAEEIRGRHVFDASVVEWERALVATTSTTS